MFGFQENPSYFDFQINFSIDFFEKYVDSFLPIISCVLVDLTLSENFLLTYIQEKVKIELGENSKYVSKEGVKLKLKGVNQVVHEGYVYLSWKKLCTHLGFLLVDAFNCW